MGLIVVCTADVSKDFLEKMRLCEATTNEYLRHFWLAVYPPLDSPTVAPVKERAAKAASMVLLLEATSESVTGLVHKAAGNNWDSAKVEQASSISVQTTCKTFLLTWMFRPFSHYSALLIKHLVIGLSVSNSPLWIQSSHILYCTFRMNDLASSVFGLLKSKTGNDTNVVIDNSRRDHDAEKRSVTACFREKYMIF